MIQSRLVSVNCYWFLIYTAKFAQVAAGLLSACCGMSSTDRMSDAFARHVAACRHMAATDCRQICCKLLWQNCSSAVGNKSAASCCDRTATVLLWTELQQAVVNKSWHAALWVTDLPHAAICSWHGNQKIHPACFPFFTNYTLLIYEEHSFDLLFSVTVYILLFGQIILFFLYQLHINLKTYNGFSKITGNNYAVLIESEYKDLFVYITYELLSYPLYNSTRSASVQPWQFKCS